MFDEKDFYKRLYELRSRKNVSARDMSLSIGQNQGYINTIENGGSLPSMMSFFYICEYLNVTPQEFFDLGNSDPNRLNALFDRLKNLKDDQIAVVESVIDHMK